MENNDTFVYKCPSCGGKVSYIDNLWHCDYCGNNYEALFHNENNELPKVVDKEYIVYGYTCKSCNQNFISTKSENAECSYCNAVTDGVGKKTIISNVISVTQSLDGVKKDYKNDLSSYLNFLPNEFTTENIKFEFINCDLYNGCVKVSFNNIKMKYVFVNVIVPNIEYDDYRFMYEAGNMGLTNTKIYNNTNNVVEDAIKYGNVFNSIEDKNYKEEIINECIKYFKQKNGLSEKDEVKVEENLKVKDGTYIPVYTNEISYNNNTYRQYKFGSFFAGNKNKTIFEFPEQNNSRKLTKKYKVLSNIFQSLAILSFILTIFMGVFVYHIRAMTTVFIGHEGLITIILIIIAILSLIIHLIVNKKYNYYLRTIKISKEEYFRQIISNSNYVKIIEVK